MLRWSVQLPRRLKRYIALISATLLGVAAGMFILTLVLASEIYDYQDTVDGVHLPSVDAIVCLAGGRGRIAAAGDLWYRYWESSIKLKAAREAAGEKIDPEADDRVPLLYLSGMGPQTTWNTFKKHLRSGVREVVPVADVVIEKESYNTETNAIWLARMAQDKGWKKILLVTSSYHMRRSQMMFARTFAALGLNIQIETLSAFQEPFESNEWRESIHGLHVTVMEYLKWVYYRFLWSPQSQARAT